MSDHRRAEIELELEYLDAAEAFRAEKAKRGTPEWDEAAYQATKRKVSEMRTYWKQIGEAVGTRTPGGMSVVAESPEEG